MRVVVTGANRSAPRDRAIRSSSPGRLHGPSMKRVFLPLLVILPSACGAAPASSFLDSGSGAAAETSADLPIEQAPSPANAHGMATEVAISDSAIDASAPDPRTDTSVSTVSDARAADLTAPADAGPLPAPQPTGYPAGSAPRTEQKSIVGPTTHQTIGFNVYLPPGYDSGALRYPVVYDLHGLTGSQFEDPQWVVPSLEAAMKKNLIGPVIVVFPDGLMQSYYADSADGKMPSETRIIRELIPYVDATYRTVANRQLRAVTGFSMGGYGAMELATKFPALFRVGVAYDAALDTWQTLVMRRASIAQAIFGNDEGYFDKYSPWAFSTANATVLRASVALRLVPGTTYQMFDASFRDHLQGLQIPLDYVETTCPHDYGCAIGAEGAQSWTFIQAAFVH
jgi:S-formylglutathione hydrolase FrmB